MCACGPWTHSCCVRVFRVARSLLRVSFYIYHLCDAFLPSRDLATSSLFSATISYFGTSPPHGCGVVVACSALKKKYRDVLRGLRNNDDGNDEDGRPSAAQRERHGPKTYFAYIDGSRDMLVERMKARKGHFMKLDMLDSQLATLENPIGEPDVLTMPLEGQVDQKIPKVVERLDALRNPVRARL